VDRKWPRDTGLAGRMLLTMFLLVVLIMAFVAILSYFMPEFIPFWILFAGLFIMAQYYFSDRLALFAFRAKVIDYKQAPRLHGIVDRLCQYADLPKPRIALAPTKVPNAFATGRSQAKAVVCVTQGLLETLNEKELEGVLAHELSHVKNRDVLVMTIASFIPLIAFFVMRSFWFTGGRRDSGAIVIIFMASIAVYIISTMLIRALSRYREFAADRGAAIMTGKPENLISALLKISGTMKRIPTKDLRSSEGMNQFFIIPAISRKSVIKAFATHPPIEKRIERLEALIGTYSLAG